MSVIQLLSIISHQIALVLQGQQNLLQASQQILVALRGDTGVALLTTVESETSATNALVTDPTYGLVNVHTMLDNIGTALITMEGNILAAIAALPAGSDIVIPPEAPSTGDIWGHILNALAWKYPTLQADTALSNVFDILNNLVSTIQTPAQGPPGFAIAWHRHLGTADWGTFVWPKPDYTTMGAYADPVAWLNATDASGREWTLDEDTGWPVTTDHLLDTFAYMAIRWVGSFVGSGGAKGAPIWPGAAGVTTATPVVLTDDAIITGPMDGVSLTVDSVKPGSGSWGVDTFESVWRGGYLIFISEEGHADVTQWIGPTDAVYTPKGMTTAGSVVVSLNKASQITVTPWTLV